MVYKSKHHLHYVLPDKCDQSVTGRLSSVHKRIFAQTNRLQNLLTSLLTELSVTRGLGTLCKRVMTALPNKRYSGHHKAADLKDDLGTPGREIWRKKCGQQVSDTSGGRWSRQSWMEKSGLWPMLHWERKGLSQSQVRGFASRPI